MKMILVKWIDSQHIQGELPDSEVEYAFRDGWLIQSVGFVVREEADRLIIAQEWHEHQKDWRFLMCIPNAAIVSRKELTCASTEHKSSES